MTFRRLLLIGLLAVFGCKKKDGSYAPTSPDAAAYPGGGGGDYYASDGLSMDAVQAEREYGNYAEEDSDYRWEEPSPAPEPVEGDGKITGGDKEGQNGEQEPQEHGRQMIYTATLQLAVYELDEVVEFAEKIPERYGGWIQARYDYQITLRVPAARLAEVMDELSTLGLVLGKTLQASDVTAEYTDLESRIAVLEQLVEQLELLLKQAKTVEDSLKVRQELERVRIELEAAKVRFRQLAEMVGFSTLTLHLSQRGADEALPSSNDPFPWVDELGVESTEFR